MDFKIAVKAFIVKEGKLLLLKRSAWDTHSGNKWDIPGGRLEIGENPFEGLKREVAEEVGIKSLEIRLPLQVQHFTRDDGQKITMIIFLATCGEEMVVLSPEHTEFKWVSPETETSEIPEWLSGAVKNYHDFALGSKF